MSNIFRQILSKIWKIEHFNFIPSACSRSIHFSEVTSPKVFHQKIKLLFPMKDLTRRNSKTFFGLIYVILQKLEPSFLLHSIYMVFDSEHVKFSFIFISIL